MLHVFADRLTDDQSVKGPLDSFSSLDETSSGLDQIRSVALASSALTPEQLSRDMGIRASDGTAAAVRTIIVDQNDSFHFPNSTTQNTPGPHTQFDISPTQEQEVAFISGLDSSGNVAAQSLATWVNNSNPATYTTTSTEAKWGANTAGTAGGTVTYFFDAASNWTATEQAVFVAAYALWSDLANITFTPAASQGAANIVITRGSDGGAHFDGQFTASNPAAGNVGQGVLWNFQSTGSTLNIDTSVTSFGPIASSIAGANTAGGHVWGTVVHEEGHSLGLGHGGPYNGSVVSATQQFSAQDMELWTVMSYIGPTDATAKYTAQYPVTGTNWGVSADSFNRSAETPMMLDILAAQRLYGAPVTTAYSGGQVYGFNSNIADASAPFYNFNINTNPVVTIWNSGTNNTLDLSGYSTGSTVNLNAGTFSSFDGMTNNLGIAFGTKIDTFVGTSGNDTVTGNNDGDLLKDGAGGTDHFTGGTANDGFFFGATFDSTDIANGLGGTNNQVGLQGTYGSLSINATQFQNIQVLALLDGFNYSVSLSGTLNTGSTFTVWSVSMTSAHTVIVNAAAETENFNFFMGQGNDTITDGHGNDLVYGEGGQDTINGGSGADTFAYLLRAGPNVASDSSSTSYDIISNFTAADKFKFGLPIASVVNVTATLNAGSFDSDVATAVNASLDGTHAVLVNSGGNGFLVVEANGTAGYQAHGDFVIELVGTTSGLTSANFI